MEEARRLRDREGTPLPEALAACGVELEQMRASSHRLRDAACYLELHIEQGPVLERLGLPLGVVTGTCGVERHLVRFRGQSANAGTTPTDVRRDALSAAARLALEVRELARRAGSGGTVGRMTAAPGIRCGSVSISQPTRSHRLPGGGPGLTRLRGAGFPLGVPTKPASWVPSCFIAVCPARLGLTSAPQAPLPLTASSRRFFAAFTSRSMTRPQLSQRKVRSASLGFHRPAARARLRAGEEPLGNQQPSAAPDGLGAELVPHGPEGLVGSGPTSGDGASRPR